MKRARVVYLVECPRHGTWVPFRIQADAIAAYRRERDAQRCEDVRVREYVEVKR